MSAAFYIKTTSSPSEVMETLKETTQMSIRRTLSHPPISKNTQLFNKETKVFEIRSMLENNLLPHYNLCSLQWSVSRLFSLKKEKWIMQGYYNSPSPSWCYPDLDLKGEEVDSHHQPDGAPKSASYINAYYSRTWPSMSPTTSHGMKSRKR